MLSHMTDNSEILNSILLVVILMTIKDIQRPLFIVICIFILFNLYIAYKKTYRQYNETFVELFDDTKQDQQQQDQQPKQLQIHSIRMFDSSPGYNKPYLEINVGDVVVWTNIGEQTHTVTSKDLIFNSDYILPGQSISYRFKKPGTYEYYSIPQLGWMIGVIQVN